MTFVEFLSGRWPSRAELIAAISRFRGDPDSAEQAIRILAFHRQIEGRVSTVDHLEKASIFDDWRVFKKQKGES